MGCCFSKENDSSKSPNEGSRLLPGPGERDSYDGPRMPYSPGYDADAVHEREQELLLRIVQRTAENLIDISNSHSIERLQQQDAIDRVNEYNEIFNTIKLDNMTLRKIKENSNNTMPKLRNKSSIQSVLQSTTTAEPETKIETSTPNVKSPNNNNLSPDVILNGGIVTKEDQDLLFKAMDEINEAIEHIEIDYVGDLVVPLT